MSNTKIFLTFLLFLAFTPLKSYATVFDASYIENFAKNYLQQKIDIPTHGKLVITIHKIDSRIKIKSCLLPLTANIPEKNNRRNVNIKITCNDSIPWQLFLTGKVTISIPVLIAKQAIDKGTVLNTSNMEVIYRDNYKIRGTHVSSVTKFLGSKAKKKIPKGRLITRKNICMVCKGDQVVIVAKSKNFMIKTQGIALASGSLGDQISIKNVQSGKKIKAQVNAINKVLINL